MSLSHFYQTFYQTEQLFRLENDPFPVPAHSPVSLPETKPVAAEPTETDRLPVLLPAIEVTARQVPVEDAVPADALVAAPDVASELLIEPDLTDQLPVLPEAAPVKTVPPVYQPAVAQPHAAAPPLLNHKVLILVDEELLPSDLLFLEKILNAINLNIRGVDLLNVHGLDGVDFAPILTDKVIHHFLTFGVPFDRLNLDILMDRYQPVRFQGITFMIADPLAAIEGDKNLKKRLWEALKRIFLMG